MRVTPFKVLIAEDEPIVSGFLEQIIAPMQELEVLAVCASGDEALRWVTPSEPSVLLTDIQMHGISGLELIRRAKEIKPDIRVIIISGYSLFEYAKEALRLGIEDYLLKPIDPYDLRAALQSIESSLAGQYNEQLNQTLKTLLRGEAYGEIAELYAGADVEFMTVVQGGETDSTLEFCMEAAVHNPFGHANVAQFKRSVLLIAQAADTAGESWVSAAGKWMLEHCPTKTICIVSTSSPVAAGALPQALADLYTAAQEERIFGERVWLRLPAEGNARRYANRCGCGRLPDPTASGPDGICAGYAEIFRAMERERYTVPEVRATVYALLEEFRSLLRGFENAPAVNDAIEDALRYADSFADARDGTWEVFGQSLRRMRKAQPDARIDLGQLYRTVAQYLQEHCALNESLQQIANRFYVSQPYISRAFREYARMSYKEYCMNLKIEIARRLIAANPEMMFKDVAERVGIEPPYFSTVFHRLTGEYPSEYKARMENGKRDQAETDAGRTAQKPPPGTY